MQYLKLLIYTLLFLSCKGSEVITPQPTEKDKYRNPIINQSLPDPTVIKANDGNFYLYATEDIRNVPIFRSSDLIRVCFFSRKVV